MILREAWLHVRWPHLIGHEILIIISLLFVVNAHVTKVFDINCRIGQLDPTSVNTMFHLSVLLEFRCSFGKSLHCRNRVYDVYLGVFPVLLTSIVFAPSMTKVGGITMDVKRPGTAVGMTSKHYTKLTATHVG